jgi:hypothetical protein
MKSIFVAGVLLSMGSVTAAGDEHYLVRDLCKQCFIVESPPTTTELALIENGRLYFERSEAERALAAACTAATLATASRDRKAPLIRADARQAAPAKKLKTSVAAQKVPLRQTAHTQHVRNQDPISSLFSLFR